jgi:energy-coupling factor transport system ATP-binding protein
MGNGLLKPESGEVYFRGRSLEKLHGRRGSAAAAVGLLFQKPERQVFAETVADDVAFGPRNLGLDAPETQRRVADSLEWVGLGPETWERSPMTLSGGQLRRAAIAGVLALQPEVLLLDEPTDGFDPRSVQQFWTGLRQYVAETDTGIYLATHRIPEHVTASDKVDLLSQGRLAGSGKAVEVLLADQLPLDDQFLPAHLRVLRKLDPERKESITEITETAVRDLLAR